MALCPPPLRRLLWPLALLLAIGCDDAPGDNIIGNPDDIDRGMLEPEPEPPTGGMGRGGGVDSGEFDYSMPSDMGNGGGGGAAGMAGVGGGGQGGMAGGVGGGPGGAGGAAGVGGEPGCDDGDEAPCDTDCETRGEKVCEGGEWSACEPPIERCNDVDDDCDEVIDEQCLPNEGDCGDGRDPEEETCNGIDDDCDGLTDEGYAVGGRCTVGVGACAAEGVTGCTPAGGEPQCFAEAGMPTAEQCNGVDDDCDGIEDNLPGLGEECTRGLGLCERTGVLRCDLERPGDPFCDAEVIDPVDEVCNGLDDDCDGAPDEAVGGGEPCEVGLGACVAVGRTICAEDGALGCDVEPGEPGDEQCNAIDDDCDGAVDEAFPLGEACAAGEGVCRRAGVLVCGEGGAPRCSAEPGEPAEAERCDLRDDDCDGAVDEGFDRGEPCAVGVGACERPGLLVCGPDGAGTVCDARPGEPTPELCNGIDDDCDGSVDEGQGLGDACVAGAGVCARPGIIRCAPDGRPVCGAAPGEPEVEACNGADDDCDGEIDEDLGLGAACSQGVGACARDGVVVCDANGEGTACDAQPGRPGVERCNEVDDDCDGLIDEALGKGAACQVGVGACLAEGVQVCDPNGGVVCDAVPGEPSDEACNGLDDDCDESVDEGFGLGEGCAEGVGQCVREGQLVCGDDGAATCSAQPGEAVAELCNALDDDCDGVVDEGFGLDEPCQVGVGLCQANGRVVCGREGEATCSARPSAPRDELCNGLDDDCDGEIDDGYELGVECSVGVGACARVGVRVCFDNGAICTAVAGDPVDERCDSIDNDCDGASDEAYAIGEPCEVGVGLCRRDGERVCADDGAGTTCGAEPGEPADERCDAADNDCDGASDEGFQLGQQCRVGLGICLNQGERVCGEAGDAVCSVEPLPSELETCNGRDDDCDGAVDEGFDLGEPCTSGLGICARAGVRVCGPGGRATCDAVPGEPEEELCDDLDNDCDGVVSEGPGDGAGVAFALCGPRYRSCLDALRAGADESGVFRISAENAAGAEVYCDQETDGGGWTLVLSTTAAPEDGLGGWHEDLRRLDPRGASRTVWPGLSHLDDERFDLRFACRDAIEGPDARFDVDVALYDTRWYRDFLRGGDAVSCFAPPDGDAGEARPARRVILSPRRNPFEQIRTGQVRAAGQPYLGAGQLIGEPACEAPDDFVVDFDDGALGGDGPDGTDWGTVDSETICGQPAGEGQWLMFAREAIDHPLGRIGLLGVPDLAAPISAAGFQPVELEYELAELQDALVPEELPAIIIGRYALDWAQIDGEIVRALECYSRAGGSVITEFDGASLMGAAFDEAFAFIEGAPEALMRWEIARVGGGHAIAADTPITVSEPDDPVVRGLGAAFSGGPGTERFIWFEQLTALAELRVRGLASYADAEGVEHVALYRGLRCGGNLLFGLFDYADAPAHPAIVRLVGNLAAGAVSPFIRGDTDICPAIIIGPGGVPLCQEE